MILLRVLLNIHLQAAKQMLISELCGFYFDLLFYWRLVRVVEGARLESVYTGNCIEGSNPSVSATQIIETPTTLCYIGFCFYR